MKKKYFLIGGLCAAMAACLITACAKTTDPFDESKFGGSSNDESNELVTDKKVKIDGKLDEDCWQNQKEFDFTYQSVRVRVKTVFGDLGFYVGYEVEDHQVYAVEGRDVWKGSSVEMYVDRGDATKKSERTFQYRLGALDQWETLYGYETKEDSWSMTYLPIYGRTQVQGTVNSGNTEGMTAEIFVRWDALGYDFTKADFTPPETVKIMPVYNQSSGAEMDSARTYWANNGGDLGNPMHYWIFDKDGFVDADAEGAKIGDSSYGRAKSAGWDVGGESEGVVRSKTAGDQYIFFKNVYATDYAVTALVEYKDALEYWANNLYWQKDPYPKAGLILASDTTIQAYLLNYDGEHRHGVGEGMFFKKGNPEPRDVWQLYGYKSFDSELPVGATNGKVRLTGVKSGRYLLVFAGTEETEKFGGTFVGMQEIAETAGNAAPGFYTLGCEVEFSDYAVTTDADVITGLTGSVLSVLKLDQKNGGALTVNQLGYRIGETATVRVTCYENYKLTSLKVNGEEKLSELTEDGEFTVEMSENEMTVTPVYERVDETRLVEGYLHYIEKNARPKSVSVLIAGETTDGGRVFLQANPSAVDENNRAEYYANLPSGTYKARVQVDGIYRASKEFTVGSENVTLSDLETPLNWVFVGDVETRKDGSVIVRGYNQYREVANRTATDYFAMTAYHFRDDGNFTTEGTWSTGGFGVKVDNVVYRIHAMRYNAEEMYLYIEVDQGPCQEYRGIYHSVSGTGAPLTMDVYYMDGEFRFLFDGTTAYTVNRDNTPNTQLHALFDTNKPKRVGLITVGQDMVFQDCDFAFNEADVKAMYQGDVKDAYTVSGTFSYANGLYTDGDEITVTSRRYSGTVNGNAWSIELPDGTHEVTLSSKRFETVTFSVTVSGSDVTVDRKVEFDTIKFNGEFTRDGDAILVPAGAWKGVYLAGVNASDGVYLETKLKRNDGSSSYGGWGTGGFTVEKGGSRFDIFVMNGNGNAFVYIVSETTWTRVEYKNIPFDYAATGTEIELAIAYSGDEIYLMLGGQTIFHADADNFKRGTAGRDGGEPDFSHYENLLFKKSAGETSHIGLSVIDCGQSAIRFYDYSYVLGADAENRFNAEMKGSVKLPAAVDGLTVTAENGKLAGLVGETVTLNFALSEGKTISSLTLDGNDVLSKVSGGKLAIVLTAGEHALEAQTEGVAVYAVTGTLGYVSGLYSAGDNVTISSGTFKGTLSGENWTIGLPDGTHEVTFESARFVTKTVSVTVSGGAASVNEKVEFAQIKFTEDSHYERDGNDVLTPTNAWTGAYFAGIDAANGMRADIKLQREDGNFAIEGGWGTGGFMLKKNGVEFMIYVMRFNSEQVYVYLQNKATWGTYEYRGISVNYQGTGAPIDLSLVYLGDELILFINQKAVLALDASNYRNGSTGADETKLAPYVGLFTKGANDKVSIGVATMDTGEATKIRYTKLAYAPVTEIPADMKGSVRLPAMPDGLTVTAENGKLAGLVGETVVLNFDLTEGKTITSLVLDGNDVLSKLSGGKLAIVLTAGEHALEVQTEGVSVYAVTGTLGYASGLYSAGDRVTISSGTFTGTLSGENWTIKLPDGTHEVTFESARFVTKTVSVTVSGGAASVNEKVEFAQIKFTEDSHYERDGNDVLTPTEYGWDNTAYFAGIDARNGIRIDAHMQRTDGNNFVNSTWQTGGFSFKINNRKFYLFFKMESGAAVVTLGDNISWTWRETCVVYPRNVTGTGASVDLSVVFLDSKLYLLIANDAVGVYDVSDTTLATESGVIEAGFFTAYDAPAMRFSNFGYSAVTELPNDFKLNRPQATIFENNNGTVVYDDGSIGIGSTTYWLKDPTGAGQFLTSDAQGNFVISYTLQRMDGYFEQEGTWDTPYFQIYIGGIEYTFFAMRENASTTVFYLNSATQNLEFRVPYEYRGTGAPLTISVAFSSDDHLLHILLGGTHYTFEVANATGSSFETMYAENSKILGFRCGVFAGVVSDISYAVTKAEVDAQLQEWGTATKVSVNA